LKYLERILPSRWFIVFIFCLIQWRILGGLETYTHDTVDSLGIFKFFLQQKSWFPSYWNWLENSGQPFWIEISSNRSANFLFWPLLSSIFKISGNVIIVENYFFISRVIVIGLFFSWILDDLKVHPLARQIALASFFLLSPGTLYFRELGMMDVAFGFTSILFFTLRYFLTGNKIYLFLSGLAQVDSFLSYHFLTNYSVFFIILLLVGCLYPGLFKKLLWDRIKKDYIAVSIVAIALTCAAVSAFISTKEIDFLPVLRRAMYLSAVNDKGVIVKDPRQVSIFDDSLTNSAEDCKTLSRCAVTSFSSLRYFLQIKHAESYALYIGTFALILFIGGIGYCCFRPRRDLFFSISLLVILAFFAMGYNTPIYPLAQKVIFPLAFIRHSLIFNTLFVLVALWIGAQMLTILLVNRSPVIDSTRAIKWIVSGLYFASFGWIVFYLNDVDFGSSILPCLFFYYFIWYYFNRDKKNLAFLALAFIGQDTFFYCRAGAPEFKREVPQEMRDIAKSTYSQSIQYRILNSANYLYDEPRVNMGSFLGVPVATEAGGKPFLENGVTRFGYMEMFMMKHTVASRLLFSRSETLYNSAFGLYPYGIVRLVPLNQVDNSVRSVDNLLTSMCHEKLVLGKFAWNEVLNVSDNVPLSICLENKKVSQETLARNLPVHIDGNNLSFSTTLAEDQYAYLSVPYSIVKQILINGLPTAFEQANFFGVAVKLGPGPSNVEIIPHDSNWKKIYLLFYGSNFLLLILVAAAAWKNRREKHLQTKNEHW